MTYDMHQHHRRSIRLKEYDYATPGGYFITVDTWNHKCVFGNIANEKMHLNGFGRTVNECWDWMAGHFPNVESDEFIVMPNHIHGIIIILDPASIMNSTW